jgi:hypothetical protein
MEAGPWLSDGLPRVMLGSRGRQAKRWTVDPKTTDRVYGALRLTYGLVPIVAGLDKFTNLLCDWTKYLSPLARNVLPFSAGTFMMIVGVIEIIAGAIVLSRFTRIGAYVVGAWLVAIAINLLTAGFYDIAVRDAAMSVSAFCLASLARRRQGEAVATPATPARELART